MKKIMLTGDRPTGKLHVGHYVGSLRRRVELQNTGDFDDIAQSKTAGMNEHFSKPLQMEKVIDAIRVYCTAR